MVRWSQYRIIAAAAFLAVMALALLIALPPTAHADGPGDWPMFRHDLAHTGRLDAGDTMYRANVAQ